MDFTFEPFSAINKLIGFKSNDVFSCYYLHDKAVDKELDDFPW